MGITDKLSGLYASAEEKFYKAMDWLELKGIPVYNYNDFLEGKGVPVFPFTIALIAVIAVIAFWLLTVSTSVAPTLSLSIKDDSDNEMSAVDISVFFNEKKIFEDLRSHAGEIKLSNVPLGSKIEVHATKAGFDETITAVTVNDARVPVEITMQKITTPITGLLKIVDEKTGLPIKGALVTATWGKDFVRQVTTDENGLAKLEGVPQGEKINVSIKADNFEDMQDLLSFESEQTQTFSVPAKTTAMFGAASLLITVFDKETNATLDDISIKIFDAAKDALLFEGITMDGQYLAQLPKGTTVRITATKSSYIKFDSTASAAPLTIREDEEALDVYLEKGGQKIKVNVKQKDSLLPILGATVSLYNAAGNLLDSNKSGFSGAVEFAGLNSDENYFVAAFLEGYNGDAKKINPGTTSEIDLVLEVSNEQNSASLNTYVYSADGEAANDATVNLFEIIDNELYPTGAPALKTAYDGFATIKMTVGKNILARAVKGIESGEESKVIVAMTENAVAIHLKQLSTVKTLLVYTDENALLESGYAQITSATEESLFDGNFENGKIVFDARGNKTANVSITTPDGNVFTEQINITDSNAPIKINLGKENNNELAPQIKFLGIIDSEGKAVSSLAAGKDYWLKFETSWIKGVYNAGIHARIGNDDIKFADSEDVGIVGYSAVGADSFYGRSWNMFPAPGNEGIDFRNAGKAGAMNKWLELYYTNPEGVKVVKVKVRVRENATMQSTMLHYRAWAIIGSNFERNPIDSELGKQKFTDAKTGLYAETIDTELSLFESDAKCEKQICVSYNFVSSSEEIIPATEFKAIKDKVFALEVTVKSAKTMGALIKASTQQDKPKLGFTGVEVESFTEFMDNNSLQSSIEVNDLSLVENAERRVRFYFKPRLLGNASIKVQLIAEDTAVNDEFFFNIFEERLMTATIVPETISVGTDFTVFVKDADGKGIEKANLQLKNESGSIVASLNGDATENNGANGAYFFKNTFGAGVYSLEISAQTFTPITQQVLIGSTGALKPSVEEIMINIPKTERSGTAMMQLENVAGMDVQNIEFEFDKTDSFPIEIELTASIPETLHKNGKARVEVSALYNGDANKTLHAEADLIIKGSVAGRYPTTTTVRVIVEYNKQLDSNCLEFDRKSLQIALTGEGEPDSTFSTNYLNGYGSNYNSAYNQNTAYANQNYSNNIYSNYINSSSYTGDGDQAEESVLVKNNCGIPLEVEAHAVPKSNAQNEQIDVQVDSFSIEPNQSKTITVTATNRVLRRYDAKETRNYDIVFTAPQLEKQLPLTVLLWDKRFAIAVRNSIVLWLSQGVKGEPVIASTPLFLQNIGESDIGDITINIDNANWEGVTVRVAPPGSATGQILKRGASLLPLRMVVAELKGGTAKGKLIQGFLTISGTINGRHYDLKRVDVWVHVSALNCLKAYAVSDLDFESTITGIGVIDKKVSVRNTCEEAVRIVDVEPNQIGANSLVILPLAAEVLEKDAEAEFLLRLTKGYDYKSDNVSVGVIGLTMLTHKFITSDRVNARVSLGEKAVETGLASAPYSVNVCNPDGTIAKEKKQVRFPIIAKTPDCTKAYCDAELAAEFIGKKISEKIEQVRSTVDRGNGEIANFPGCASILLAKACSFARMGVKSDSFDLYMGNDNLTDSLMKKTLVEKNSELRDYSVNYCAGKLCEVEAIAATGFPNLMYLSDSLRGCGKYRITVDGAVFASGMKIQEKGYTIAVNVSSKQTTPECINKITNAMNFLPQDATQSNESDYGAWPGMVEAGSELEEAGKATAKELFGKEERYFPNTSSNKLVLALGEMKAGIVKLQMTQEGIAAEPKTITATINQALGTGKEAVQKEIAKEAANAIASLKTQRLEEGKSCVSADDSFMVIGSYLKFGQMTISGPSEIKMKQGNANLSSIEDLKAHSCIDLNINSKIAEEVYIKTNAQDIESKSYGIAKVYLRLQDKDSGKLTVIDEKTIAKLQQDMQTKEYRYQFQLCAIGSKEMSLAKKGIEIKVWAESRVDPLRRVDPPKTITAKPCATHPYDLLNALDKKQPGEYYANVGWKGEPDSMRLSELSNKMDNENEYNEAKANVGAGMKLGNAFTEMDRQNRLKSIWGLDNGIGYVPICSATTVGFDVATGIGVLKSGWDVLFNCLIPAGWASMSLFDSGEKAKEFIENQVGKLWNTIKGLIPGTSEETTTALEQQTNDSDQKEITEAAIVSAGIRDWAVALDKSKYIPMLQSNKTALGLKKISSIMAEDAIKKMQEKIGPAATAAGVSWKPVQDSFSNNIFEELKKYKTTIKWDKIPPGIERGKKWEEVLGGVFTKSTAKTFPKGQIPKPIMEQIVNNKAAGYSTAFKTNIDEAVSEALEKELSNTVEKITPSYTSPKYAANAPAGSQPTYDVYETRKAVTNRVKSIYASKTGAKLPKEVETAIRKKIDSFVPKDVPLLPGRQNPAPLTVVELSEAQIKQLNKEIMAEIKNAGGTYADDIAKSVEKSLGGKALEIAKEDLKLKVPASTKWAKFGLSLLRGIAGSVISNWAGLKAFDDKMETLSKDIGQPRDYSKPLGTSLEDIDPLIKNGETYKIVLTPKKNSKGEPYNSREIKQVTDLTVIPSNANWIEADCTGNWAEKEIGAISDYSPKAEKIAQEFGKNVGAILAANYYSYATAISDSAQKNSVPQDLLLAVLTADAMARSSNAQPNNCGSWLEARTIESGKTTIDCVAAKTKAAYVQDNVNQTFNSYFKELQEKQKTNALDTAAKALSLWQSMKTQKSS